jgi:hypothetical protein
VGLDVVSKNGNLQILVYLFLIDVPSALTLGLYHLQLPDVGAGSRPADRARTVLDRTDLQNKIRFMKNMSMI